MNTYVIKKVQEPITESSFKMANVAEIKNIPWPEFSAPYTVEARILHTEDAFYVNMRTDEWPLLSTHVDFHDDVCEDSCMEFFFSPDGDDNRYFNFEVNANGIMNVAFRKNRYDYCSMTIEDVEQLHIKTEIEELQWSVEYEVPYSLIEKYFVGFERKDEIEVLTNFFKCGDETVFPHYGVWKKIDVPEPDFHRPEYFGKLLLRK